MRFVNLQMLMLAVIVIICIDISQAAVIGGNPCTWGPAFWCDTLENAQKCGVTEAECNERYNGIKNKPTPAPEVIGAEPCTWGPAFWCDTLENAIKCGVTEAECNERYNGIKNKPTPAPEVIGAEPCTWGPAFWCDTLENAIKCGVTEAECNERYNGIKNKPTPTPATPTPTKAAPTPKPTPGPKTNLNVLQDLLDKIRSTITQLFKLLTNFGSVTSTAPKCSVLNDSGSNSDETAILTTGRRLIG